MKKDQKADSKETKEATSNTVDIAKQQIKLGVFEEDDYFEEFDDEDYQEGVKESDIDFKQWQEDWEDDEINDQFEKVLRREIEAFKAK